VSSEYKLSANIYQILLTLHSSGSNKFKWIDYVKSIIDDTGLSNIWIFRYNLQNLFGTPCHLPVSIGNVMLQVLNLHITVLNPRLSLNKYDSSIFFLNVNRILHHSSISNIEKINLQFCKRVLSVRPSTPNCMVYAEMDRFPLELQNKN
jgi:hypothetical protein